MVSLDIGIWVSALLTLAIYSFLYKDNPIYRFAEASMIGFTFGYYVVAAINSLRGLTVVKWMGGDWESIIPLIMGFLLYFRFVPGKEWIARPVLAFVVGGGMGLAIRGAIHSEFILQIAGSIKPIPMDPLGAFTWLVMGVGTISALIYFVFGHFQTGILKPTRKFSQYLIMIALGATFAGASLTYITNVVVRLQFLIVTWLGL